MFRCPICGNQDDKYIGYRKGKPYCRRCISFRGNEPITPIYFSTKADYKLNYELTKDQLILSKKLVHNFQSGINSLVNAVCGAGKTEIVLEVIKYAIEKRLKVGFAVPRVDVVKELYIRFKEIFKKNKLTLVYGGHHESLQGDLVCLTTHQLFRYEKYFDLLILDEIDAFPYQGNEVIKAFFYRAVKGQFILMSATPSNDTIHELKAQKVDILYLNTRFHMQPLPVPKVYSSPGLTQFIVLIRTLKRFIKKNLPTFVFAPTIPLCEKIYRFVNYVVPGGNYVHSKCLDRSERIENFRKGKYSFLITTAVLERGVTVKNLQVIIMYANHPFYKSSSLIQISGRAGRKIDAPTGEVIFICEEINDEINRCINTIKTKNKDLQNLF